MTELQVRDINHLLKEMSLLDLDRSDPPEFKNDTDPTGEEIQALLLFYKENFRKYCHLKTTLHVRFTRIEDSIRKLATFDRTFLEKACKQLQERKEQTMVMLGNEMNGLRNDIESLTEILAYMTDFDMSQEEQARLELVTKCRTAIRWNPAIPEHDFLHAIFGLEDIPVIMGTDDIDYEGIELCDFEDPPSLSLDVPDFLVESAFVDRLVLNIYGFIIRFDLFYGRKLGILFEHLAWRYIVESLRVRYPDVQRRYTDHMLRIPRRARSWSQAKAALHKALGLDMLRPHLIREILLMTPEPKEQFASFATRIYPLLDVADIADTECGILIMSIVNILSDYGVQAVLNEYGSLDTIPSLRDFLRLLSNTPNALGEPRTDRTHLFFLRYGGSKGATMVRKAIQARDARLADCSSDTPASYGHSDTLGVSSNSTNPSPISSAIDHVNYNPSLRQQKRPHFIDSADIDTPAGSSNQHFGNYDDYNDPTTSYASPISAPPRPSARNSNKKHKANTNTNSNASTNSNNAKNRKKVHNPCGYAPKCRGMPYKHEASQCYIMLADMRASPSDVKEGSYSP